MIDQTPTVADLGGSTELFMEHPDTNEPEWTAFNPSIARGGDGRLLMAIRSSNYSLSPQTGLVAFNTSLRDIRTRTWMATLTEAYTVAEMHEVTFDHQGLVVTRGVEDPRLFWDGQWYFTATMMERHHTEVGRVVLYSYNPETHVATLLRKFEGPIPTRVEKNWMPIVENGQPLRLSYSPAVVYGPQGFKPIRSYVAGPVLDEIRGGSCIIQDGRGFLAIVHRTKLTPNVVVDASTGQMQHSYIRHYFHRFASYNRHAELVGLSREFIFDRLGVEYAAGFVRDKNGLVISYGRDDQTAHIARLDEAALSKLGA